MRRPGLSRRIQHPILFVFGVRFADGFADFQLERLLLAKTRADEVAGLSQNAQRKAYFLVDGLRSSSFFKPVILIFRDDSFVEVHQHLASEQALEVVDCIFREGRRIWKPQLVALVKLGSYFAKSPDSLLSRVREVVEALLQFAAAILLCRLGNRLGRALARLLHAAARKPKFIPPNITSTKRLMIHL